MENSQLINGKVWATDIKAAVFMTIAHVNRKLNGIL